MCNFGEDFINQFLVLVGLYITHVLPDISSLSIFTLQ